MSLSCMASRGSRDWRSGAPHGSPRVATRAGTVAMVSSRGHLYDHIALSVADLDAWIAKLRGEGVTFLEEPYKLGATRAVMIEGPSCEAIELVEVA